MGVPESAFIAVDDFVSVEELAAALAALLTNATAYAAYFQWRADLANLPFAPVLLCQGTIAPCTKWGVNYPV